ncbi:MAG: carbamate kinase [Clostridiaceae bacterium]
MKRIVIALGGNALQQGSILATSESQLKVIKETSEYLADLIEKDYEIIITHGNGPQVGRILIQNEYSKNITPAMPIDVCGAMSQGMIGYHIQQSLKNELVKRKKTLSVLSLVTQVIVDKNDECFKRPTKPIGPFYSKEEAGKLEKNNGYVMVEDSGRGYRRVVASPKPVKIVELEAIKSLIESNHIVITVGGGGIPVVEEDGIFKGVPAVIDKDLASEKLAEDIDADILVMLTAVDKVAVNYGKIDQKNLDRMTVAEAENYIQQGQFPEGSMLPKVEAAVKFASGKEGRVSIVASLKKAKEAIEGHDGTIITK